MEISMVVELVISVITLISGWFMGNKSVWGPRLSLLTNFAWWFYILAFKRYGLIPMEIFFLVIIVRNLVKWEREAKEV